MRACEKDEIEELNAEPWMIELLKINPEYVFWGPDEDYMWTKDEGWNSPQKYDSWESFGPWELNELNECVNFYFEVIRLSKNCELCDRTGFNSETKKISDEFYNFDRNGAGAWVNKITQDEVEALQKENRLDVFIDGKWTKKEGLAADEVNKANTFESLIDDFHHDAINRHILIETRAKRLGVYGLCPECHGDGYVYTEKFSRVNLVIWMIHPRKGASRGVEIGNIKKENLTSIFEFLKEAKKRNNNRFRKISKLVNISNTKMTDAEKAELKKFLEIP